VNRVTRYWMTELHIVGQFADGDGVGEGEGLVGGMELLLGVGGGL